MVLGRGWGRLQDIQSTSNCSYDPKPKALHPKSLCKLYKPRQAPKCEPYLYILELQVEGLGFTVYLLET